MNDEAILERLLSGGTIIESAWKEFLRQYSRLFLKIIWQFEKDHDEVMEMYVYVCRKFSANDFVILRKFKRNYGTNPPKFTTWLAAVTRNLCIDAHRSTHGRRQLPRALRSMPEFDRLVFQLHYWKGYTVEEIEQTLKDRTKGSPNSVGETLERLAEKFAGHDVTRQPQRPTIVPFDDTMTPSTQEDEAEEMAMWMEEQMKELSTIERMILRLRFWEDMRGAEIAAAMNILPSERVYPMLQKALQHFRAKAERIVAPKNRVI